MGSIKLDNASHKIELDKDLKLDTMKIQISDQDMNRSHIMKMDSPSPHNLSRTFSKESIKIQKRQDTHEWLKENDLRELIPIFDKEGLTAEHFEDVKESQL